MSKHKRIFLLAILILSIVFAVGPAQVARAAVIFTVNDNGDDGDFLLNGICETATDNGVCTLRAAIEEANSEIGIDTIQFDLNGPPYIIVVGAAGLPEIDEGVIIDGTSQSGYSGSPIVQLDGAAVAGDGLKITGGNSTVKGLVIRDFGGDGIELSGSNGSNVITNNYIGTILDGSSDAGNDVGIRINDSGSNVIGGSTAADRNVISGNAVGIIIEGVDSIANSVTGNYIGTNSTGLSAVGNTGDGVRVTGAGNTVIGGTTAGVRNIISGNGGDGVQVTGSLSANSTIAGNYIGTDVTGLVDLGNSGYGVRLATTTNITVGGSSSSSRNIISGNGSSGVLLDGNADGNFVRGNYIGLNKDGDAGLGNTSQGIHINNADNNTIGGSTFGQRNVISDNGANGINIINGAAGNTISGNRIGTNPGGTVNFGNGAHGVRVDASDNTIGGESAA
ncbi:MAG: right-handed parallel beta-helix repeat-containing protein, partial [Chloroflexi bacterium]|nr:right-handed parallel beta-helix repeat-containing protein [Chloroflexota bacterium]